MTISTSCSLFALEQKILNQERITVAEAVYLFQETPLDWLQKHANSIKQRLHGQEVYYNRNIHFEPTNKCIYSCKFCSFYRTPKSTEADGAWDYTLEDLKKQLDPYPVGTLTEVHITGGVHPDRGVEYGEELVAFVKKHRPELHVKAFTAVEIAFFAKRSRISIEATLKRLQKAGLDSLPGGGAEIFDSEVRKKIAGGKAPTHQWLEIHELAHNLGMKTNSTMLYGHVEDYSHRVDHMARLREVQDRTQGFNTFIPLRYLNVDNALSNLPEVSKEEDFRNFCVARIFLDNIPHLKAYWVMLGMDNAVKSLDYGVDDLDGTVDDSTKIYSMAGSMKNPTFKSEQIRKRIVDVGKVPVERDSLYNKLGI